MFKKQHTAALPEEVKNPFVILDKQDKGDYVYGIFYGIAIGFTMIAAITAHFLGRFP